MCVLVCTQGTFVKSTTKQIFSDFTATFPPFSFHTLPSCRIPSSFTPPSSISHRYSISPPISFYPSISPFCFYRILLSHTLSLLLVSSLHLCFPHRPPLLPSSFLILQFLLLPLALPPCIAAVIITPLSWTPSLCVIWLDR